MTGKQFLKAGLFAGGLVLVVGVFIFTHLIVQRLSREVETTSRVLARFCAQASLPATNDPQLHKILLDVVDQIDFPIVVTDTLGVPRAWKLIGVPTSLVSNESTDSVAAGLAVAPVIGERIETVRAQVRRLDRNRKPIEMWKPDSSPRLGYVHYGEPAVMTELRWMPIMAFGGTGILVLLGLSGLASIRVAERRTIWVGMAKETAHQLGTPLSSLLGWIELLRGHEQSAPSGEALAIRRAEFSETLDDMERDVERLSRVAQRFSHVGSTPNLQLQDPTPAVREAVDYVRRRLPQGGGEIQIVERYLEVPPINLSRELLEWAVENLLSNAVDALNRKPARIVITLEVRKETEAVEIIVEDTGRGMSPTEQKRAFEPGFTTKRRGWGLGLALARRVVEEYHGGRLFIRHSAPGQGTTIVASFPT